MVIKIATLNLCLGLRSKKDEVKRLVIDNEIDVLCVQETEIPNDYPVELLTFKGYGYESELNCVKSRCGIYVSNKVSYLRRHDLEVINMHVMIIDLNDKNQSRIINMYRPFNPVNNLTQKQFFEAQLVIITRSITKNTILLGDFNLDFSKRYNVNYSHKHYFENLNVAFEPHNLIQIINFNTWSRIIKNVQTSSIIDHVYLKDPTSVSNLTSSKPFFGDHSLISFQIATSALQESNVYKRNWKNYSKAVLVQNLTMVNWNIEVDDVQSYWNTFESNLVEIIDKIAPLQLDKEIKFDKSKPTPHIKNKINKRNRLLKKLATGSNTNPNLKTTIKSLNKEIKLYFHKKKSQIIRRGILPGNSKSLWDAVKISKDVNLTILPEPMFKNDIKQSKENLATVFGEFFRDKVVQITNNTHISPSVYNGQKKVDCPDSFFMSDTDIMECLKTIKIKNCEGYDRIPQRVLVDGAETLLHPLKDLFIKIYYQKKLPEQWLISKIIPIHKKGPKCNIENYRPIANLCSTSKIFEKLILKRIQKNELGANVDLSGKQQHGFKKSKSTATLGLQLQSLIARALDERNYVLMGSIDLSAAFDVVNVDLLLRRLRILGLPGDVVSLIEIWLKNRMFYVEVDGLNSNFYEINSGTIQGSILGPILYAIFVSPLFDLTDLSNFADDNFALTWNLCKLTVVNQMKTKLDKIITWLQDSGLKVNESKTELCLFYRRDTQQIEIFLGDVSVKSKAHMNVLGVCFDSKLSWSQHTANSINKAQKALHAIKLIKKYFSQSEILTLLTANFYSILYYNSEIWHLPSLKPELKQSILSASARALKLSQTKQDPMESFYNLHKKCQRALPNQIMEYKHALLLYKIYNTQIPPMDWIELNFNQTLTSRETTFNAIKSNNTKIGNNILSARLTVINKKIKLDDLNLSLDSYKVKYKQVFLKI